MNTIDVECDQCEGEGVIDVCDQDCGDPDCDHLDICGYCNGQGYISKEDMV